MKTIDKFLKKVLLLIAFLGMPGVFLAQHCDSIDSHVVGWNYTCPTGIIQLGNGDMLSRCILVDLDENGNAPMINGAFTGTKGFMYYWISRENLVITDSLFIQKNDITAHLWTRLHQDENTPQEFCNLDASVVKDENNASFLNIAFFDDQLNYNDDMEVTVPLSDNEVALIDNGSWLLDSHNDIVLCYSVPSKEETHFVRFGLDGTLKNEKIFTNPQMPFYNGNYTSKWRPQGLRQYSNDPLGYNYYGWSHSSSSTQAIGYELDSLFNITMTYELPDQDGDYPSLVINGCLNGMVSLEDGSALFVRNTQFGYHHDATGVVKYDREGNIVKEVWLDPFDNNRNVYCVDFTKDNNGNIYFTAERGLYEGKQLAVIKMDENLNVIWEYSGMNTTSLYQRQTYRTAILNDDVFAVIGCNGYPQNLFKTLFLALISKEKGNAGVDEANNSLRPYLYYPNPVADRLKVHYSPDASPKMVELYDLQGHLVRTQTNGFQSIDMLNLPSGTYTMRVVLDNGKAYSDKIVKQ